MKIIVTGGAGFVGSNLIKKLLEDGHDITCIDNLLTGSHKNIESFTKLPIFKFLEHDICDPIEEPCDQIYNLACPASPVQFKINPIAITKACTIGVNNMLELARDRGARILQASTSEVYGDPEEHPQKETYKGNVNILGERACYDVGKRLAESMFMAYKRQYGVDIRIVRIFNTYGLNMLEDDGRVVSNFITQALAGKDLTVYGDGSQTRSFQFIDDLVDGLIKMMNQNDFEGPVNMGNPNEITVNELAQKILELTNSKSKIIYKTLPQDDPTRRQPDINLAKAKLGWEPQISLEEGLKKTILEWPKSD